MKIYMVGGAVRDALLGFPVQDRDWVVVGATPQQLLAAGYIPVGKDFPVFLHPETHEEVALARTERKTARGYHGFTFHTDVTVTLEEDLARRDLTINAIAQDEQGRIIDPYGGQQDLHNKMLRHVTSSFAEDPVRILRVARFAARYVDFQVAPETMALMQQMVANGEVDALVAERVWQELSRGLMEQKPSRMLEILHACGAMAKILPEVAVLFSCQETVPAALLQGKSASSQQRHIYFNVAEHIQHTLDASAKRQLTLAQRYALLLNTPGQDHCGLEKVQTRMDRASSVSERLHVPTDCRDLAILAARELPCVHAFGMLDVEQALALFQRSDAYRKPGRFKELLGIAQCDAQIYMDADHMPYPPYLPYSILHHALQTALSVDTKSVAQKAITNGLKGEAVGQAIEHARKHVLEKIAMPAQ